MPAYKQHATGLLHCVTDKILKATGLGIGISRGCMHGLRLHEMKLEAKWLGHFETWTQ